MSRKVDLSLGICLDFHTFAVLIFLLVLNCHRPSQSKITQFNLEIFVYQNILWFEIPVKNLGTSQILQSHNYSVGDVSNFFLSEVNIGTQQLFNVFWEILKNEVNFIEFGGVWHDNFVQSDDVFVFQHS